MEAEPNQSCRSSCTSSTSTTNNRGIDMELPIRLGGHSYAGLNIDGSGSHVLGDVIHVTAREESPAAPSSTFIPRSEPQFIERHELLARLGALASDDGAWTALVGLGGVGKTQLAIRYAHTVKAKDRDLWILWISASNAARFDESVRDVCDQIRLFGRQKTTNILQLFHDWLTDSRRRWLIFLDNADNADVLLDTPPTTDQVRAGKRRIDYIPQCNHGKVMLTSRSKVEARNFVSDLEIVEVLPMDAGHAKQLLQRKLGSSYNEDDASRLAIALDYMPLALSQAASFILQRRSYTIARYLEELETNRDARTSLLQQHGTVPKRDRDASSSILLTWQISFEHVRTIRESAADLLALMCLCDRQAIPKFLLLSHYREKGKDAHGKEQTQYNVPRFEDDMQLLEDFSFVSTTRDDTTWEMHRLVQDATHLWLVLNQHIERIKVRFLDCLYDVTPTAEFENWSRCRTVLPHIKQAMDLIWRNDESRLCWSSVAYRAARYSMRGGSLVDAERFVNDSLLIRTALMDEDDTLLLWTLETAAEIHDECGRWQEAEKLELEMIEKRKKLLGEDHEATLRSMTSLAIIYTGQGRCSEAEQLLQKIMKINTEQLKLGPEHVDVLKNKANLAVTYNRQGRWAEAESINVMEPMSRVLGAEHPFTLTCMSTLASTYFHQQRWVEAEQLHVAVIKSRTKVLGAEHADTLGSLASLAGLLRRSGRLSEAESLLNSIIEVRKRVLGEQHPHTVYSMGHLAQIYIRQERASEAESLLLQTIELKKKLLGVDHPDTLQDVDILTSLLREQKGKCVAEAPETVQ